MPQKLLVGTDAVSGLQQMGGKRVTQGMAGYPFCDSRDAHGLAQIPVQRLPGDMESRHTAGPHIPADFF